MAVTPIEFGKNLRPSTVEAIKKINELVTAVNAVNVDAINQMQTDVNNIKNTVKEHTSSIGANTTDIGEIKKTQTSHTQDIDKIKVTLYTPLSAEDATE